MAKHPKILALAGSLRKDSFNKKLVKIAAAGARKAGAEVAIVDLADYPLPLYDGDLEAEKGIPENAKKLKKLFIEHNGFLFASPEYNSSVSGTFKNVIDWVSRPDKGEAPLIGFKGKIATIMSASPGALGGLRGLVHLKAILGNMGVVVLPDQVTVSVAHEAFNEDGQLKDPKKLEQTLGLGANLSDFLKKFSD